MRSKTLKPEINDIAFDMRVNKGILPTIEISGHTFYVDIRMDKLRPKDDFLSKGIVFSEISKYYDEKNEAYTIPYNPVTHEFQEPNYKNLSKFPDDLIAVKFPSEKLLDPIGFNRITGCDESHGLADKKLNLKYTAELIPWDKTFMSDLLRKNVKEQDIFDKSTKGKGRKI